jgi:type I restriction enzyme S subunit
MSMTEKKMHLVPRLRFPEFRDAGPWEVKRLGEVFTERTERGGSDLELLSVTISDGVVRACDIERANNASTDLSNYKRVYPGDIVYNTMRMWQGASGASQWHGFVSPAYTVITPAENQNPIFWAYYFKLPHSIEKFTRFSQGLTSDTWNLKYPAFSAIKVAVPTNPTEQQKIADCLSSLDEVIELETRKLEALKAHKKSLLQQLFPREGETTPRLRFPEFRNAGPWEVKRLGEIFTERTERGGSDLELLSVTIADGVVRASDVERANNASTDLSNYKRVYPGDIVYNTMRMWQGASGASQWHGVVSPAYTVITPVANQNPIFWAYYFKLAQSIEKFTRFSQGLTSDTWNLKYPAFSDIKMAVPTNPIEQQKIADCLSSLDEVIALETRKLEALKAHKRGLMQQLFPREGETTPRLRFPEFRNAGPWEVKRLGEVCEVLQGYGFPERFQGKQEGKYPFCKVSDITNAVSNTGGHIKTAVNYLDEEDVKELRAKPIPKGATVFAKIGEALRLNRRAFVEVECLIDNNVAGIKGRIAQSNDYFLFYLSQLIDLSKHCGGAVPSVNKSTLESISIFVPSLPEQQKIADCLSSLDEVIELEARKLEALKAHKKGLMQQLFPQEVTP